MTPSSLDFSPARILVVGDVILDHYWHGMTARISPEAPVPIVKVEHVEYRAGGAANVALNIATLGGTVSLLGVVGDDLEAAHLEKCLTNEKVDCHLVTAVGKTTITKLRVISRNQQMIRLDFENNYADMNFEAFNNELELSLNTAQVVIFSDYAKGTLNKVQQMIAQVNSYNLPIIVDPKSNDFSIYHGATILTPNLAEFEAVVGHCVDDMMLISKATQLCFDLSLHAILITRGAEGMLLVSKDSSINFPANDTQVVDVTGAGDTVVATLACALSNNRSLQDSVYLANLAAGLVVKKSGTDSIRIQELNDAINKDVHDRCNGWGGFYRQ